MDPQDLPTTPPEHHQHPDPLLQEAEHQARLVQRAMLAAAQDEDPISIPKVAPVSMLSAQAMQDQVQKVLEIVLARINQIASLNEEQWQRAASAANEIQETMKLAQVMIAEQDDLLNRLEAATDQIGLATSAIVKINQQWQTLVQRVSIAQQQQAQQPPQ